MNDLDQAKVNAFSEKMLDILNGSMLSLTIGIGYQTGLFEVMANLPPSTSEQIAVVAELKERYVREWLAAMVVGQIIDYDPTTNTYSLSAEHASVLTKVAGPNNMARLTLVIPFLASVQKAIVNHFHKGGGVSYSAYPDFMNLWAEINADRFDATITQKILPLIPDVVEKMRQGVDILDIGCGDGHVLNLMAKAFPNSRFTGYDFLENGINAAREKAQSLGLTNVNLEVQDLTTFNEPNKYALITAFDVIHDMAQPAKVLKLIADSLQPDGTFLMVDLAASSHLHENLDNPLGSWLYTTSCMHCMTVSLGQNGAGLGAMWGEQKALKMLNEAGFINVDIQQIPEDIFNNYYIAKT
ncbi:class I SAM-dependent methyltransferase [Okeania sp. KiyG1]|uniref:class I SAM-dependent methyltransferase n=1 Tax=Okeania sp. KiyG1 TaxID=2720165 RepID=UPI001924E784|nr:class I SAM-dependent methyltransferase [Okeania sp. KiyG1]GGA26504.1 transcriptional regulator [Okeania sp. KiyG1]